MTETANQLSEAPEVVTQQIVSGSIEDLGLYGVAVEVDPETAEQMGAFEEDALSLSDAMESVIDAEIA